MVISPFALLSERVEPLRHCNLTMRYDPATNTWVHSRADLYRERAAECERQVALVRDSQVRAILSDLADQWRDLARQVETLDR